MHGIRPTRRKKRMRRVKCESKDLSKLREKGEKG